MSNHVTLNFSPTPSNLPPLTFRTRATTTPLTSSPTLLRPWRDLVNPATLTRPVSFTEATIRIKRNLVYFRVNYTLLTLAIIFLSLLWHPVSIIVFLVLFVAWFFLYFSPPSTPLSILGRTVDDRFVLVTLWIVTVVALALTRVGLNVLVSVSIGVFVVVVHAAFRGTEDLYLDDLDNDGDGDGDGGGGLFSFVSSPTTTATTAAYSRI